MSAEYGLSKKKQQNWYPTSADSSMFQESIGIYNFCQPQIVLLLLKEMWLQHRSSHMGGYF